jgi:hypothetical protein
MTARQVLTSRQVLRIGGQCARLWILAYAAFILDCRFAGGAPLTCWRQNPFIVPIADIERLMTVAAGAGLGGWLGYNTYNPSLRDPRRPDEPS